MTFKTPVAMCQSRIDRMSHDITLQESIVKDLKLQGKRIKYEQENISLKGMRLIQTQDKRFISRVIRKQPSKKHPFSASQMGLSKDFINKSKKVNNA